MWVAILFILLIVERCGRHLPIDHHGNGHLLVLDYRNNDDGIDGLVLRAESMRRKTGAAGGAD